MTQRYHKVLSIIIKSIFIISENKQFKVTKKPFIISQNVWIKSYYITIFKALYLSNNSQILWYQTSVFDAYFENTCQIVVSTILLQDRGNWIYVKSYNQIVDSTILLQEKGKWY